MAFLPAGGAVEAESCSREAAGKATFPGQRPPRGGADWRRLRPPGSSRSSARERLGLRRLCRSSLAGAVTFKPAD